MNKIYQQMLVDALTLAQSAIKHAATHKDALSPFLMKSVAPLLDHLDLPSRREMDELRAMLVKARTEQVRLEKKLAALEGKKASPTPAKKMKTQKKCLPSVKQPKKRK